MRRTVVREGVNLGKAMPDEDQEAPTNRNVDADVVGYDKSLKAEYDEYGKETVASGTTLKIETSPGGQEIFSTTIAVGDTVYWGIKRAQT